MEANVTTILAVSGFKNEENEIVWILPWRIVWWILRPWVPHKNTDGGIVKLSWNAVEETQNRCNIECHKRFDLSH
uniref:Uncharacterized protein n=1 Tax=Vitis vinifera TaxID=29760 RepID=A5CAX2_VITVI|nr:hypothetical protein VITISV_012277 [Vitis vinifera]